MERIKLNLIPSGVAPIVHLSQYDDGRKFGIDLFEGESVYVLDGTETLTVNSRKPDGHVVVLAVTNTGTSSLDVDTVEQLTAVHGVSYAKLKIEKGSVTIATLPFLIDVSRDPLENGDPSESFIQNLETQVSEMVAEDVAEQYDSANVIFDNEPTENHGIGYTVTSEGIKTAIDNAFDYDNTASGSLVHITDGADNIPVKSLVSEIVAVESGNGQPKSPDNPYTISGFDSGVVSVCGVNLWDEQWEQGTLNWANGSPEPSTSYFRSKNYISCKPNTTYRAVVGSGVTVYAYDKDKVCTRRVLNSQLDQNFTTQANEYYLRFRTALEETTYQNNISINYPSSDTQYHAYKGNTYTFTFGQTVYGGHFDNKGNLANNRGELVLSSLNWYYSSNGYFEASINIDCPTVTQWVGQNGNCGIYTIVGMSYVTNSADRVNNSIAWYSNVIRVADNSTTDVSTFVTKLQNQSVYYELANPTTLAITSQDIPTLLGENNIFSNCGDVEVNYYTNKSNDILELIDSEIGKKNGTNIPIEANSQDSIKDYVDDEISSTKDYVDNGLSGKADTSDFAIEDLSSSVTLNSAFDTPDYKKMYKYGNVIHLMMRAKLNSNLANNSAVVTMPSRVAPKGNDYAQNLYYGTQYATTTPLNCYFGSFDNGLHTLGAISSGQYVMIDTMWITN